LCLPVRPDLQATEIDYVCDEVRAFFQSVNGTAPCAQGHEVSAL
jgi:hypothetical protein